MVIITPYHELNDWEPGDTDWNHTDLVNHVEAHTPKLNPLADRPSSPPVGRLYYATDVRHLTRYDPDHPYADADGWVVIGGVGTSTDPLPGTTYLETLDVTGDLSVGGTVTSDLAVAGDFSVGGTVTSDLAVAGDFSVGGTVTGDLAVGGDITEGGEPIATARSTKTIDVLDHGSASDADAALDAAVTAAEPHDTLLFRDNTFVFAANHQLSKPVNFRFENATIDDQRSNITAGDTLFEWTGPGIQQSDVLQADVGVGHHTISVGTAGWASAGDVLYIEDSTGTEPITQYAVVDSVVDPGDGTQDITVEGIIRRELSANADVHIVDTWDRIRVEGAEVLATHGDGELFAFRWCHRPRVEDVFAHEIGRHTVQFSECYDPIARDCEARNAIKKGSGEGEPFICFRCTDVTFENCRAQDVRRGIDITLGTTGATIVKPHIEDYTKGGVSAHDGDAIRDITIIGGEISSTDPNDNPGISMAGMTENISVYGTKLVAHRKALLLTGRADVQGVQIELAELPSADPELITVRGENVSVQGAVHVPTYEEYVRIADVNGGASNIDLNLDITIDSYNAGGNENPLIQVSAGASDVRLRGSIDSVGGLSLPAIRLYGMSALVENVDIEMNIRGHGHEGVQCRGDAGVRGLRVTDSLIDVDGDCVNFFQYDTGTTIEDIWVRDCTLLSTNGSGLDASAMAADSVWFLDNAGDGLANAGSVTNLHSERAELDKNEAVTGVWNFQNGVQAAGSDVLTTADESVVDSGTVQLSSGATVIDTGLAQAAVDVALDPSGGGQNSSDVKVSWRSFFDSAAGTVQVEIFEDGSSVGNPYVGYEITER